jgi:hypothetical protein
MDKPRLVVRLAVALLAFVIGITSTLLVNYLWPGSRARQAVRYELRFEPQRAPRAHAPCPYHEPTLQPAFEWKPEAPPPPEPPPPPPPPQSLRPHATH